MEQIKQEILNSGKAQEIMKKEKRNLIQNQKMLKKDITAKNEDFTNAIKSCSAEISNMMKAYSKKSYELFQSELVNIDAKMTSQDR